MELIRRLKKFLKQFSINAKPRKTKRRKKRASSSRRKPKTKPAVRKKKAAVKPVRKKVLARKAPARKKAAVVKARKTRAPAAKKALPVKSSAQAGLVDVGAVTHYFPKVHAAVVKLEKPLAVGDTVQIAGAASKIRQKVTSLQINRIPIDEGRAGEEVGLLVKENVAPGDRVYKMKAK